MQEQQELPLRKCARKVAKKDGRKHAKKQQGTSKECTQLKQEGTRQ